MRRLAALLVLGLALAAPAGAQEGGRIRVITQPPPTLRGPVEPAPAAEDTAANDLASLIPAPLPVAPTSSLAGQDNRQCRRACSQEYYFCLSAEDEICPGAWVKCTARCGG